ncbi:CDP-diacylglycerol--glycerol-3-phosphate 3-phosphatidyltransferase [Archangium primigenium]|uniref:CDP-diacylglycerol--glycerol-3-phosphate 3-phosphatidyltransferase n=1 Tax=Melittangium TaxID=44 RepID=UPI00195EABA4|nr:CDP-diacylglycerol--glycerol-3-phosphate 3-phosphatidyltransferase [Archangium primigenium]MBM7115637.1 CDP-diacylglycerol--glycerol-3-phosphate 3-phosphatidyltransferase [Archangium primigenium]
MDRAAHRRQKKEERVRERARKRANRKPSVLVQEFWNLPNILTLGRILLIPLFVWLLYAADPLSSLLAAAVFAVASITDVVDGYLARRWNLITVVGKFMDPLADKLIAMAALVMMVRLGRISAWIVVVLLAREFIISGLRTIAANEGMVIAAGQEGKWKTSLQLVGIISLCVHYEHTVDWLIYASPVDFNKVGQVLVYLSAAFSVWSAVVYFRAFLSMLARRGGGDEQKA